MMRNAMSYNQLLWIGAGAVAVVVVYVVVMADYLS